MRLPRPGIEKWTLCSTCSTGVPVRFPKGQQTDADSHDHGLRRPCGRALGELRVSGLFPDNGTWNGAFLHDQRGSQIEGSNTLNRKAMFVLGFVIAVAGAVIILTDVVADGWGLAIGIIGVGLIAASRVKPDKT